MANTRHSQLSEVERLLKDKGTKFNREDGSRGIKIRYSAPSTYRMSGADDSELLVDYDADVEIVFNMNGAIRSISTHGKP